jgi:hypothetical protein
VVRVLVIIAFLAAWFLPLIIAALYKLPHQGPIAVLSLALGWTGVGWLAALVITVGGAIRATRPALAAQGAPYPPAPPYPGAAQPQAAGTGQAYAPAQYQPAAPYPGATQPQERVQAPEPAPSPERPPSRWPDSPR